MARWRCVLSDSSTVCVSQEEEDRRGEKGRRGEMERKDGGEEWRGEEERMRDEG